MESANDENQVASLIQEDGGKRMSRWLHVLLFTMLANCMGCVVVSEQPILSDEFAFEDDRLVGTWVRGEDDGFTIEAVGKGRYRMGDGGGPSEQVEARLYKMGDTLMLDVKTQDVPGLEQQERRKEFHALMRVVDLSKEKLVLANWDRAKVEVALKKSATEFDVKSDRAHLLLRDSTEKVQAFVKANAKEIFSGEKLTFRRKEM